MTPRSYSWGMFFLTLIFLGLFSYVLIYIDPDTSGPVGKIQFYGTLFLFMAGLFNLFLTWLRKKLLSREAAIASIGLNIRQGILLSLLAVSLLVLQSFRMLVWWDGLLVVAGIFLIELYFLSRH